MFLQVQKLRAILEENAFNKKLSGSFDLILTKSSFQSVERELFMIHSVNIPLHSSLLFTFLKVRILSKAYFIKSVFMRL